MKKLLRTPTAFPFLRAGLLAVCALSMSAMASSLMVEQLPGAPTAARASKPKAAPIVAQPAAKRNQANAVINNQEAAQQQVNAFLGLAESQLVLVDLSQAVPGQAITVTVNAPGQPMTLDLVPYHIRTDDYQLLGVGADGVPVPFDPGPERTLRGRVREIPGAHVAGSLMTDGLYVTIRKPDGQRLWVEAVGQRLGLGNDAIHAVYDSCNTLEHGKSCGMAAPEIAIDQDVLPAGGVAGTEGGTICIAELANDCDFEFFQAHGASVPGAQDRVELVMNTTNLQYETEVGITHVITTTLVRFAEPDPYTSFNNTDLLCQFINQWVNFHANVHRDVAQLWTGREVTGSVIGQAANLGNICDDPPGCSTFPCNCNPIYGTEGSFCFVQSDFNGNFSCATDLSAHELGHLWSAQHCTCPGNTMNPSITCTNFFGTTTANGIINYRNTRQCLDCQNPLVFTFPNGIPSTVSPDGGTTMRVVVSAGGQTPMPGTGFLHYSTGGSFSVVPMMEISNNVYDAVFPAVPCGTTIRFYVSAETTGSSVQNEPIGAPTQALITTSAQSLAVNLDDDFESNMGWTVTNGAGLTAGAWQRAVPNGGGVRGDPPTDADGSGQCYVTQNGAGDTDVDGGSTTLTSPILDASGGLALVSYYRWFSNDFGGEPNTETFTVEVSDNGGASWSTLEVVGPAGAETSGGWFNKQFDITSAGIAATNQFRIRFTTQDPAPGSVVEAGVDGVRLVVIDCDEPVSCLGDIVDTGTFNPPPDGLVDGADLAYLLGEWGPNPGSPADLVDSGTFLPPPDGVVDGADLAYLLGAWGNCP